MYIFVILTKRYSQEWGTTQKQSDYLPSWIVILLSQQCFWLGLVFFLQVISVKAPFVLGCTLERLWTTGCVSDVACKPAWPVISTQAKGLLFFMSVSLWTIYITFVLWPEWLTLNNFTLTTLTTNLTHFTFLFSDHSLTTRSVKEPQKWQKITIPR